MNEIKSNIYKKLYIKFNNIIFEVILNKVSFWSIFQKNSHIYSLTENKYCGMLQSKGNYLPWRKLLEMEE